mmetsp:Transcript_44199/g.87702  ORF Transcript_44199/g.87702 Transcript_44199/m.87702 type:complete len:129 (+) Transcript_44199:341-727(+)
MWTALLRALQAKQESPCLVRIVLLMLVDMLMTTASMGTADLINVALMAQVVQTALRQPSTQQKRVWAVTSPNEDTLWRCTNHAGLGYLEWSVLIIVHEIQVFHAVIAQFGVVPNVLMASACAMQALAV